MPKPHVRNMGDVPRGFDGRLRFMCDMQSRLAMLASLIAVDVFVSSVVAQPASSYCDANVCRFGPGGPCILDYPGICRPYADATTQTCSAGYRDCNAFPACEGCNAGTAGPCKNYVTGACGAFNLQGVCGGSTPSLCGSTTPTTTATTTPTTTAAPTQSPTSFSCDPTRICRFGPGGPCILDYPGICRPYANVATQTCSTGYRDCNAFPPCEDCNPGTAGPCKNYVTGACGAFNLQGVCGGSTPSMCGSTTPTTTATTTETTTVITTTTIASTASVDPTSTVTMCPSEICTFNEVQGPCVLDSLSYCVPYDDTASPRRCPTGFRDCSLFDACDDCVTGAGPCKDEYNHCGSFGTGSVCPSSRPIQCIRSFAPTTVAPTASLPPTSPAPTTVAPTASLSPVSPFPTTVAPTDTLAPASASFTPTTVAPTASLSPISFAPTTVAPTTFSPTTFPPAYMHRRDRRSVLGPGQTYTPTSMSPTTVAPTTLLHVASSYMPTTVAPTGSLAPVSHFPTTVAPTDGVVTTYAPTTVAPTHAQPPNSYAPTTVAPTVDAQTAYSQTTMSPTIVSPASSPIASPTVNATVVPAGSDSPSTSYAGSLPLLWIIVIAVASAVAVATAVMVARYTFGGGGSADGNGTSAWVDEQEHIITRVRGDDVAGMHVYSVSHLWRLLASSPVSSPSSGDQGRLSAYTDGTDVVNYTDVAPTPCFDQQAMLDHSLGTTLTLRDDTDTLDDPAFRSGHCGLRGPPHRGANEWVTSRHYYPPIHGFDADVNHYSS